MKRISLLLSLTFALFLVGNALAVTDALDAKSSFSALPALERPTPSQGTDQYDFDLAVTNIGMEQKPGSDWNDCPEFCEYWQFWVKIHNAGYEIVSQDAWIVFTINGEEIGREPVEGLYPSEVRKLISPEFHIEWPEKCDEFMIDAHVEWRLDENPENDRIAHIKYVSGHVDECLRYDDGVITNGWTWNPGLEYPDYCMASKWHFEEQGTVVYVEFWLSQTAAYPTGHVEFFVWVEDPNNPGYPLEPPIYRNEYQLIPDHFWPDQQWVCFPVCIPVLPSDTYFFGYSNRQETIQFLCIDVVEDYPDRNLYKNAGVWYTGPYFGDWFIHPCIQTEWEPTVTMTCETLTPVFCRGKEFYFTVTVDNNTAGGSVAGNLTFTGYRRYDCVSGNELVTKTKPKTYPDGVTTEYYFFKVPNAATPGPYSAGVSGTLTSAAHGDFPVNCCMNTDCIDCGPWKIGDNTEWSLHEVDRPEVELPTFTSLDQNYPNPFNASTNISFSLAEAGNVSLNVYDITGRLVVTLVDGQMDAGQHVVVWDGSNVSSGVYFYKLSTGDYTATKSMNLLK